MNCYLGIGKSSRTWRPARREDQKDVGFAGWKPWSAYPSLESPACPPAGRGKMSVSSQRGRRAETRTG